VLSKACKKCEMKKSGFDISDKSDHDCPRNFDPNKSSGSMEVHGLYHHMIQMHEENKEEDEYKLEFSDVVTDDDTSIRIHLSRKGNRPNKHPNGKLPPEFDTIRLLSDPGHRIKCWAKLFFKLTKETVGFRFGKSKAIRTKHYIGCFV
jgi:hypothetical protein